MSTLVFEATAVECACRVEGTPFHGYHPVVVMAGQTIWVDMSDGYLDKEDAEEVAEERLRSRLGLLLADCFAVKGIDT